MYLSPTLAAQKIQNLQRTSYLFKIDLFYERVHCLRLSIYTYIYIITTFSQKVPF